MKQKILYIIVAAALILSACGGGGNAGKPSVARIGWAGSPDTLNPGTAVLVEAYTIFELVYDSMYNLNLDGSYSLSLADSMERSSDGLTYTFHIKKGIKFSDGQPLTAHDIAFTYNLYKAHADFPYMNAYTVSFDSVEAPDDTTLIIKLTDPVPSIESALIFMYVLPEHIWKDHKDGTAATEFENVEMVGSGPFKMVEYKQNEFVHLAANKDYFGGAPKVDEIVFQHFESKDALVQAIKSGQVDMITEMPSTAVAALKAESNVEVVTGAPLSPGVTDIIFNQTLPENCPKADGGKCTGHPALQDRNVRLALAHATDKQKLIDVILLGLGTPGLTLIPDGLGSWFNNSLKDYGYDVAKANQILDDAGYKDVNGDGVREMPDGTKPLIFRLNWPSDSIDAPRMAELLTEMWAKVGVKTQGQAVDPDALTAQCCPAFDFDIILWGWSSDPDPNALLNVMRTDSIATGYSETGYSSTKYDDLFVQQGKETDPEKRKQLIWEMQKTVFDDVVYIIPYYEQSVQAYRKDRFTGWQTGFPKLELSDPTSLTVIAPVK